MRETEKEFNAKTQGHKAKNLGVRCPKRCLYFTHFWLKLMRIRRFRRVNGLHLQAFDLAQIVPLPIRRKRPLIYGPLKTETIFTILAATVLHCAVTVAQTWTPSGAPNIGWWSVSSSADGNKLFAAGIPSSPYIYGLSTNAGATWTTNVEPQSFVGTLYGSWVCTASSADGNTLMALTYNGVWTSTNSGLSWSSNNVPGVSFFRSVALSADGQKAVAADGNYNVKGGIYISTNSGTTWSQTTAPIEPWFSVASSADGTVLAAATMVSTLPVVPVYVSTNSGMTWQPTVSLSTNINTTCIAASVDGSKLVVGGYDIVYGGNGLIFTSTNYGNTWTSNSLGFYPTQMAGVASSADGNRLAAIDDYFLTSTNAGMTWYSNAVPSISWLGIASSADGTRMAVAGAYNASSGSIYTWQSTPAPQLNLTAGTTNVALSWMIPSTNFVLQQNSDLTTANWLDVTNVPVLDLTNLQNQVTLPAPANSAFFRLTSKP